MVHARRVIPSADDATIYQLRFISVILGVQSTPEFMLVYMYPMLTHATSFDPVESDATARHFRFRSIILSVQSAPEFVLVQIVPS